MLATWTTQTTEVLWKGWWEWRRTEGWGVNQAFPNCSGWKQRGLPERRGSQDAVDHMFAIAQNGRQAGEATSKFMVCTHEILMLLVWGWTWDWNCAKLPGNASAADPRTKKWDVRAWTTSLRTTPSVLSSLPTPGCPVHAPGRPGEKPFSYPTLLRNDWIFSCSNIILFILILLVSSSKSNWWPKF